MENLTIVLNFIYDIALKTDSEIEMNIMLFCLTNTLQKFKLKIRNNEIKIINKTLQQVRHSHMNTLQTHKQIIN